MAIETTQPPGQEGPGWPRQLAKPLDRLRSLLDTALLPGAAGEGGGRSVGSPPRSLLSELVDDAFLSDEEWSLSSLGSVGGLGDRRRCGRASTAPRLMRRPRHAAATKS